MKIISIAAQNPRQFNITGTKPRLIAIVLAVTLMAPLRMLFAAGPAPVDLRSAAHFTILATSTTTTTGGGIINGDVGLSPVGSQGIPPEKVHGRIYNGDPIAAQAQSDLTAAIIASSPAQLPGGINAGAELGGKTLVAGVYESPAGSYGITGDVTLFGGPDDVWVFQMASTLTVAVSGRVILTGGAQARNVFWQVGSSATLGTSSVFKGTIMAYASISMNANSTLDGRALAQNGAVTFNGDGGSLSIPAGPIFARIVATATNCVVALNTAPYFLVTLQTSPDISLPNWTTIATNNPATNIWVFADTNVPPIVNQRFYRAFITMP